MIQISHAAVVQEERLSVRVSQADVRWPFIQTLLFVLISSSLLWALIIVLLRWLFA